MSRLLPSRTALLACAFFFAIASLSFQLGRFSAHSPPDKNLLTVATSVLASKPFTSPPDSTVLASTEAVSAEPAPTEPAPTEPAPTEPGPTEPAPTPFPHKFVVALQPVGGTGDRLRCIILGYYLARFFDREFYYDPSFFGGSPLIADNLYEGRKLNAKTVAALFPPSWTHTELNFNNNNLTREAFEPKEKFTTWEIYTNQFEVAELVPNPYLHTKPFYPTFKKLTEEGNLTHQALQDCIKPSPLMEELLLKKNVTGEYFKIGIHLRHGDDHLANNIADLNLEDDTRGSNWDHSRKLLRFVPFPALRCFRERALHMWEALGEQEQAKYKGPLFFVSSDSRSSTLTLLKWFSARNHQAFNLDDVGVISHIDKSSEDQDRTLADWWLLARMDRLVISQSGYSETAAKYSCAPAAMFYNNMEAQNEFEECAMHFLEFPTRGLCVPEFDVSPGHEAVRNLDKIPLE